MALDPAARYASAASMASALEGWLADPAAPGTAAPWRVPRPRVPPLGAAGAAATVASAQARPNAVPYPPGRVRALGAARCPGDHDRHAAAASIGRRRGRRRRAARSPWAWIAGLLGLGILVIVGFLVFRMLTGGGGAEPSPSQRVPVRGAVDGAQVRRHDDRRRRGGGRRTVGLVIVIAGTEERTDVEPDTVLTQDPAAGAPWSPRAARSSVTVSRGKVAVAVPDLRGKPRTRRSS